MTDKRIILLKYLTITHFDYFLNKQNKSVANTMLPLTFSGWDFKNRFTQILKNPTHFYHFITDKFYLNQLFIFKYVY